MAGPVIRNRNGDRGPPHDGGDVGATYRDDLAYRQSAHRGRGPLFGVMAALFFASLGAALYALGGWPWQSAGPAIAVPSQSLQPRVTAQLQTSQPTPASQPILSPPTPPPQTTTAVPFFATVPPLPPAAVEQQQPSAPAPPPPEPQPPVVASAPAAPPLPAAPPRPPAPTAAQLAEARQFVERADRILQQTSDIAAARLFLDRAAKLGDPNAVFRLAETFDPSWLARIGAKGVSPDTARARQLYQQALDQGVPQARDRLAALR